MLSTPAPFPYTGAEAILAETGEPARILQHRGDGRVLISLPARGTRNFSELASGNMTVTLDEIRKPEGDQAGEVPPASPAKPRRKRTRKSKP